MAGISTGFISSLGIDFVKALYEGIAQSFVEAIMFLKENIQRRQLLGENSRKFVQVNFSRQILSDKYLEIIGRVVEQTNAQSKD